MSKKNTTQKKSMRKWILTAIFLCIVLLVIELMALAYLRKDGGSDPTVPDITTIPSAEITAPAGTAKPDSVLVPNDFGEVSFDTIDLGNGLLITDIAAYTGAYVEDGSNEVVADVLMVVLENSTQEALQYATISLRFGEETGNFAVTNLPAGARVVLLEQSRMVFSSAAPDHWEIENVVFLPEFEMYADIFEISGEKGSLTVKNISGQAVSGDIYVYYKNSAQDIFYGGITYRARVDGLEAGESKSVIAGHYTPTGSAILMVSYQP